MYVNIRLGEETVRQELAEYDWTIRLNGQFAGRTEFPVRFLVPGPQLLRANLCRLFQEFSENRRAVGLLILGLLFTPVRAVTTRWLRRKDLEDSQLVVDSDAPGFSYDSDEGRRDALAAQRFGICVKGWTPTKGTEVDLDGEVLKTVTPLNGNIVREWANRASVVEARLIEDLLQHGRLSKLDGVTADALLDGATKADAKQRQGALKRALKEFVERRTSGTPVIKQIIALRAVGAVDALFHDTNSVILENLPPSVTPAERRAFRFFFLRIARPASLAAREYFNGVISNNGFLMSLLRWAPDVTNQLALTLFVRPWPKQQSTHFEGMLHRRLVGLLKFGRVLLEMIRKTDATRKDNREVPFDGSYTPASLDSASSRETLRILEAMAGASGVDPDLISRGDPKALAALRRRFREAGVSVAPHHAGRRGLTAKQRKVVELKGQDLSFTEIGQQLGIHRTTASEHYRNAMAVMARRPTRK